MLFDNYDNYIDDYIEGEEDMENSTFLNFCLGALMLGGSNFAKTNHDKKVPVTIWVHGTGTIMGKVPYIYSKAGLHKVNGLDDLELTKNIAYNICKEDPKNFSWANFYSFGWSGELSYKARYLAAEDLYKSLISLSEHYQKLNLEPVFKLITHSHGGNVALNLGKVKASEKFKKDLIHELKINELILLACPVQDETKDQVNNNIFNKIYSIYSPWDVIQVADPQVEHANSWKDLLDYNKWKFSDRKFKHSLNLRQVEVRSLGNRGLAHVEFISPIFAKSLPKILSNVDWRDAYYRSIHYLNLNNLN